MLTPIQIHTYPHTMTHMNPPTQPKHTRSIPSAHFPLSLPLLLAGITCQGVFSGEVHALQLTQRKGLISYLSHLQSQDQVLFPHPPFFASYPRKVCFFSGAVELSALLRTPVPLARAASPLLPPSLQCMGILLGTKLPLTMPWQEAAPGPHRREGSTPHPALNCAPCHGQSHPSHPCPFTAGEEISPCPFPPSQGRRELSVINVCQVLRDPQMKSAMGGGRMINLLLLLQFNAFPADSVPGLSRG